MIQLIGLLFYCVWTTHHFVIDTDFHSKGFEDRADGDEIKFLVLHYTEGNFESSLNELTKNPDKGVHYLLPAKPNESDWIVYQLVEEKYLAYHAGLSQWQNYTAINRYSVGIEIVNLGFDDPYPPKQIEVLMQLCADIIARYT